MKDLDQLRYPIGKFEYGKTYSIEDTRKHINILDKFPKELKKTLKKLKSGGLDTPYRPDGWTVRQVVHHLADSHVNAYIRMKLAVTEDNPTIKPYNEVLWADTDDGKFAPVKVSLKIIAAIHKRWVMFMSALRKEDLNATYYHPGNQRTFTLQEGIALYVWHSRHHLAHVELVVKAHKKAKEDKENKANDTAVNKKETAAPAEKSGKTPKSSADAKKPRTMSEEHKAKIREAQAIRWGKKAETAAPTPTTEKALKAPKAPVAKTAAPAEKKPRTMSEEHKAKIREAQAIRWGKKAETAAPAPPPAAEKAVKTPKAPVAKTAPPATKGKKSAAEKPAKAVKAPTEKKPRTMSEEHKAKIREAQAIRWGKKAETAAPAPPPAAEKAVKAPKAPVAKTAAPAAKGKKSAAEKPAKAVKAPTEKKPRTMSEEHKAKIREAQAIRWGKKAETAAPAPETTAKASKVAADKPKAVKAKAPVEKAPKTAAPKTETTGKAPKTNKVPGLKPPKAVKAPAPKTAEAPAAPSKRGRPKKQA